jgi:hypothetical protein
LRNEGRGSAESPALTSQILDYSPVSTDVMVIEPMLNDVRRFGCSASGLRRYEAALSAMLSHICLSPQQPRALVLLDPGISDWVSHPPFDQGSREARILYAEATRRLLEGFPGAGVVDLDPGWDCSNHMADDGVHPNAPGTKFIAERVLAAIRSDWQT